MVEMLATVSTALSSGSSIPMARQGEHWLVHVESEEKGRAVAAAIDGEIAAANSYHEADAVAPSDPVSPRDVVHVIGTESREAIARAIQTNLGKPVREASQNSLRQSKS